MVTHAPTSALTAADPILVLIEAHRAAFEAWNALADVTDSTVRSSEAYAAAAAAEKEPRQQEIAAMKALLAGRPTTSAGAAALAEYLVGICSRTSPDEGGEWEEALRAVSAGLRATLPAIVADPDLVSMVDEWTALHDRVFAQWQASRSRPDASPAAEEGDIARLEALERAIYDHPSVSLADLAAKAPLLAVTLNAMEVGARDAEGRPCLEWSAWSGVVRDLQRLGASAAPATAATAVGQPHPDAELLALGREFDEAHAAWLATITAHNEAIARFEREEARLKARGLDKWTVFTKAWEMPGVQAAYDAEGEAFLRLEPLNNAIKALPARTVEGLAVKARAVAVTHWTTGDYATSLDKEWGDEHLRDLVEATCDLAGVDHLGRPTAGAVAGKSERAA